MGLGRNPNILLFSATRLEDILAEMVSRGAGLSAEGPPSGSASSSGACLERLRLRSLLAGLWALR